MHQLSHTLGAPSAQLLVVQVLDRLLEAKEKVDRGAAANQEDQENNCIDAFHALTSVRALLASGLQSGVLPARSGWRLSSRTLTQTLHLVPAAAADTRDSSRCSSSASQGTALHSTGALSAER